MSQYGMYIGLGIFALMVLIIFPIVFRKTRRAQKQANDFFPNLGRQTGLQVSDSGLHGMYKGYQVHLAYSLGANVMSGVKMFTSGNTNAYGKNTMFPRLHVTLHHTGNTPSVTLYDTPGLLSHTSQRIQDFVTGAGPDLPAMQIPGSKLKSDIGIYTMDQNIGTRLATNDELARVLQGWKYTDIRLNGNQVKLSLDNNSAPSTIGIQRMYTPQFAIQALDITVAAANAALK